MRNVVAFTYAVLAFLVTQQYFSRFDDPFAGHTVFLVFGYVTFNITQRTLIAWAALMISPIDHVSVHARLIICMLAPILVATILARMLYVITGISPFLAAIVFAFPWLWMMDWTHRILFPQLEEIVRGIARFFIPRTF